jgi:glycosyltransferase involved in cell wall biosynthesis
MTQPPNISIITPSFNQGQYIERTITSVISQDYPNIEYIIIDGGSDDDTVAVIKKYEPHIRYWVSEPDKGQTDAIKKGFERATGEFLMWLNSDDYLLPSALSRLVEVGIQNREADIIAGLTRGFDLDGNLVRSDRPIDGVDMETLFQWMAGTCFGQPSTMFSRKVWEECGPFDESLNFAFDLDFWIRATKAGFVFATINEFLSEEICHDKQKTSEFRQLTIVEMATVIISHGGKQYARQYLDEMAIRLELYKRAHRRIANNPLIRMLRPVRRAAEYLTGRSILRGNQDTGTT